MQHVFVVDAQRRPLMPCRPARARLLLTRGQAAVVHRLLALGLPVEAGSGGLTKFSRTRRGLPKTHWLDACCVRRSTLPLLRGWRDLVPLLIMAQRWQRRQMCLTNEHGFPRTKAKGTSRVEGFRTGDMVKAVVPSGKPRGTHIGKVAVKARGYFTVASVPGVPLRYCRLHQHADGYGCTQGAPAGRPPYSARWVSGSSAVNIVREETTMTRDKGAKGGRACLPFPGKRKGAQRPQLMEAHKL